MTALEKEDKGMDGNLSEKEERDLVTLLVCWSIEVASLVSSHQIVSLVGGVDVVAAMEGIK